MFIPNLYAVLADAPAALEGYLSLGVVFDTTSLPDAVIQALRDGHAIADTKLEALGGFTAAVVQKRGVLDAKDLETFFAAGYSRAHVLEVIVGVAMKTISSNAPRRRVRVCRVERRSLPRACLSCRVSLSLADRERLAQR